ncbi:MAG: HD domain-containing protein [Anaerolineales bacterium]|nr:HD domain-containing protein [Anaerolineales bacterium]
MNSQPDYQGAIEHARQQLKVGLSAELTYHSFEHTFEDVLLAVERLAKLSRIDGHDLQLLRVAAAFHDTGYISTRVEHEIAGIRIVAQVLPDFGFGDRQIDLIIGMILATRLPQSPRTFLEEIIADADLDSLGREDFFERSEALRKELAAFGHFIPKDQWYPQQRNFLQNHTYFTAAARNLRDATKDRHIATLEKWIAEQRKD